MKKKTKTLTVDDLCKALQELKASGEIKGDTQIWLSSDEDGNHFAPLVHFPDGSLNAGKDENKLTLYPLS